MIIIARVAKALGLNLNWIFDPIHALRTGQRVFLAKQVRERGGKEAS